MLSDLLDEDLKKMRWKEGLIVLKDAQKMLNLGHIVLVWPQYKLIWRN